MNRKKAKEDKKLERKLESEKAQQTRSSIKAAKESIDLLDAFPAFRSYDRNGLQAQLVFFQSSSLPAEVLQWAFELCRTNMKDLYDATWGWNDKRKMTELKDEDARFLVAFKTPEAGRVPQQPLAYIHFRFEAEDAVPVLYVYEIQLGLESQRKGLGRMLMKLVELFAFKAHMQAVMLTVMEANEAALALYSQLGYVRHPSCPDQVADGKLGYLILHKPIRTVK